MIFFRLSTAVVALMVFGVIMGATAVGLVAGRSMRERPDGFREALGVIQAALLGFMGLVLAFGLTLAVGRYEARRAAVVTEANAIGTTYLRAQMLAEPIRSESLDLLKRYTDTSIAISELVPGSAAQKRSIAESELIQRRLWTLAGEATKSAPQANATRLYVETLNETFDAQTTKVTGLANRVPTTVLLLELAGAAFALAVLGMHTAMHGRGIVTSILAAALVSLMLFIVFDLDRPTRGFMQVPSTALDGVRASIEVGPSATGPPNP